MQNHTERQPRSPAGLFSCKLLSAGRLFSRLWLCRLEDCLLKTVAASLVVSGLVFLAAVSFSAPRVAADSSASSTQEHHLRLYHTHTGERIDIVPRGDQYLPEVKRSRIIFC